MRDAPQRVAMPESKASVRVGYDELATLRLVALDGGLTGPVKVSCAGLAGRLDASSQTASRRLQRLEDAGYVGREVVSDGQWITVLSPGENALRREYEQYRRVFEGNDTVTLRGTVTGGMGEGRHYISLPGYQSQFRERLGYEPYPGTLNVELTDAGVRSRARLDALDAVPIDGWEDDDRTFGPATCYPVTLRADGGEYEGAHIVAPERTHHDESQLEVIAPDKLREELGLEDGESIELEVSA